MGACWQAIEDVTIARKRATTSRPIKLIWNVTWNKQRIRGGAGRVLLIADGGGGQKHLAATGAARRNRPLTTSEAPEDIDAEPAEDRCAGKDLWCGYGVHGDDDMETCADGSESRVL